MCDNVDKYKTNKQKNFILNWCIEYTDGMKRKHTDLFGILANTYLLIKKYRPSFLIQYIDYNNNKEVIHIIKQNLQSAEDGEGNKLFYYHKNSLGLFVMATEKVVGTDTFNKVKKLGENYIKDDTEISLGKLLGYTECAGELNDTENKYIIRLLVGENSEIMTIICTNEENSIKTYSRFNKMKDYINSIPIWEHLPKAKVQYFKKTITT